MDERCQALLAPTGVVVVLVSVRFFCGGGGVGRVDFLGRTCGRVGWGLEVAGIFSGHVFAGHGGDHEIHPDGESGMGSSLLCSQRFFFIVADPDSASG